MSTGSLLHHDDTSTDRSPGSDRNTSEEKTKTLWMKEFQEKLAQPGTMYRGEAPNGKMADFSSMDFLQSAPHEFNLTTNDLDLTCSADMKDKLYIELTVLCDGSMLCEEDIGSMKPIDGRYKWERVGFAFPGDIFSKREYSLKVNIIKKSKLKYVMSDKSLHR